MDDWDGPDLGPLTTGVDHAAARDLFHVRRRRHRRRRRVAIGVAAVLVVVGGIAAVGAATGSDGVAQVATGPPEGPTTSPPSTASPTVPGPEDVAHPTYLPDGYSFRSEIRDDPAEGVEGWTSRYDPLDLILGQIQVTTYRGVDAEFFDLGPVEPIEAGGFEATLALTVPEAPDQGLKVITLRIADDLAVRVVALGALDVAPLVRVAASIEFGPVGTGRDLEAGDPPPYAPPTAEMPDLVGVTVGEANLRLAGATRRESGGFLAPGYVANDEVPAGLVVTQGVPAGSTWPIYDDIAIEVSAGGPVLAFADLPDAARQLAEDLDGYDTAEPVLESTTTQGAAYKTDAWFFGPCAAVEAAPAFPDPEYRTSCY